MLEDLIIIIFFKSKNFGNCSTLISDRKIIFAIIMRCSLSHIREAEADRLCPRMIGASTVALGVICRALLRTRTRQNKFSLIKKKTCVNVSV